MSNLFTEITENRLYHNQTNYDALDSIENHLDQGWKWCENKEDYEGFDSENEDEIPLSFTREWCDNTDFDADNKQISVDILTGENPTISSIMDLLDDAVIKRYKMNEDGCNTIQEFISSAIETYATEFNNYHGVYDIVHQFTEDLDCETFSICKDGEYLHFGGFGLLTIEKY